MDGYNMQGSSFIYQAPGHYDGLNDIVGLNGELQPDSYAWGSGSVSFLHQWNTQPLIDAELAHLTRATDDYTSFLNVGATSLYLTSPVGIHPQLHHSLYENLLNAPPIPQINKQGNFYNVHDSIGYEVPAYAIEEPVVQHLVEGTELPESLQHSPFQFHFRFAASGASHPTFSQDSLPPPMFNVSTNTDLTVASSPEKASSNQPEKIPVATSSTQAQMGPNNTGASFGADLTNTQGERVLRWTEPFTPSKQGRATKRRKTTHSGVFIAVQEPQVEQVQTAADASLTTTKEATEASESDSPAASSDAGSKEFAEGSSRSSTGADSTPSTTPSTSSSHPNRTWAPRLRCEWTTCSPTCFTTSVDEMMKGHLKVHGITLSKGKPKAMNGVEVAPVECMWEGCGKLITRSSLRNHMIRQHVKADRFRHAECSSCGEVVNLKDVVEHEELCL